MMSEIPFRGSLWDTVENSLWLILWDSVGDSVPVWHTLENSIKLKDL